jgi:hypothetical protein
MRPKTHFFPKNLWCRSKILEIIQPTIERLPATSKDASKKYLFVRKSIRIDGFFPGAAGAVLQKRRFQPRLAKAGFELRHPALRAGIAITKVLRPLRPTV